MGKSKRRRKRKTGRPSLLTPALTQKICSFIVAGTYDYVAAGACGISHATFMEWMRRGEGTDRARATDSEFAKFAKAVRLAKQTARASTEITVKKIDPKWWLSRMHRHRPGEPGWTDAPQIELTDKDTAGELNADEYKRMISRVTDEERATFFSLWNKMTVRVPVEPERPAIEALSRKL